MEAINLFLQAKPPDLELGVPLPETGRAVPVLLKSEGFWKVPEERACPSPGWSGRFAAVFVHRPGLLYGLRRCTVPGEVISLPQREEGPASIVFRTLN